jgi:hypothetical protein
MFFLLAVELLVAEVFTGCGTRQDKPEGSFEKSGSNKAVQIGTNETITLHVMGTWTEQAMRSRERIILCPRRSFRISLLSIIHGRIWMQCNDYIGGNSRYHRGGRQKPT